MRLIVAVVIAIVLLINLAGCVLGKEKTQAKESVITTENTGVAKIESLETVQITETTATIETIGSQEATAPSETNIPIETTVPTETYSPSATTEPHYNAGGAAIGGESSED